MHRSAHVLCTLKVCTLILTMIIIVLYACVFCYRLDERLTNVYKTLCTGVHVYCMIATGIGYALFIHCV